MPQTSQDDFQRKFQRSEMPSSASPSHGSKSRVTPPIPVKPSPYHHSSDITEAESPVQGSKDNSPSREKHPHSTSSPQDSSLIQTSEESENCDSSEKCRLKGGSCPVVCVSQDEGQVESQKLYGILQNFAGGSQRDLKNEVEQLRCQLHCQRKSMECLNQTVGGLQSESCQHIQRIEQLKEDTKLISACAQEQKVECMMEEKIQEVWRAMMRELSNLKDYIKQWAESEQCNRNEALDALSRELQESKTFLWKEVENLRADLEQVQSRLGCQEVEICNHQADIKAMKHIQAKSRKVLRQLVGSTADVIPDCPEVCCPPGGKETMEKDLANIWATMSCLQSEMKKLCKSSTTNMCQGQVQGQG
ncbi:coiled-coil domain-containing protein 159-like [Ambystoma mexicanum]|uniref:coiled-coil domain-containing protein 159-like n=1 Tax=Ambystoma mexicanum TaxID=8296 RepID=UPI0037E78B6E